MRRTLLILVDVAAAALLTAGIWGVNYVIPQQGIAAQLPAVAGGKGLQTTKMKLSRQDWHQTFASQFTDQIVSTDTSYTSPDLLIHLTFGSRKTNTWEILPACRPASPRIPMESDIMKSSVTCLPG